MNQLKTLIFSVVLLSISFTVQGDELVKFESDEQFDRYRDLIFELRCPKCQNQNLQDSNSQISIDLRNEVERLIKDGKTDDEIRRHMVSLYGDFILYRPPVQNNTLVLWGGPIFMLGLGALIFGLIVYRRSKISDELDDEDMIEDLSDDMTDDTNNKNNNTED